MRWDRLFADLEAQLERELRADEADLGAERERLRLARLTLRDRVAAAARGGEGVLAVTVTNGDVVAVRPTTFGRDWFAGDLASGAQCVVPLHAVAGLTLAGDRVRSSLTVPRSARRGIADRVGVGVLLRELCRRRVAVTLTTPSGVLRGTIDRVGADHVDLALHEPGTPRRMREVAGIRLVPLARLLLVRVD